MISFFFLHDSSCPNFSRVTLTSPTVPSKLKPSRHSRSGLFLPSVTKAGTRGRSVWFELKLTLVHCVLMVPPVPRYVLDRYVSCLTGNSCLDLPEEEKKRMRLERGFSCLFFNEPFDEGHADLHRTHFWPWLCKINSKTGQVYFVCIQECFVFLY